MHKSTGSEWHSKRDVEKNGQKSLDVDHRVVSFSLEKKRKQASFSALLITTTSDVDSRLCNDCYHDQIVKAISLYLLPVCH